MERKESMNMKTKERVGPGEIDTIQVAIFVEHGNSPNSKLFVEEEM